MSHDIDCAGGGPLSIRTRTLLSFGRVVGYGHIPPGTDHGNEKLLSPGGKIQRSRKLRPTTGMIRGINNSLCIYACQKKMQNTEITITRGYEY